MRDGPGTRRMQSIRTASFAIHFPDTSVDITQIIQELITVLSGTNLQTDLQQAEDIAIQLFSLIGLKDAARDVQSWQLYSAATLGSVTAAQQLYHNAQPDSGMPHEDIVDGQHYWAKLLTAGWTVNGSGLTGTVVPPAKAA